MPFRCRQKLSCPVTFIPLVPEERTNKEGMVVIGMVESNKKLPDVEMFDLKTMIEAGVDMEEVNAKVLTSKVVNADTVVRKYTKKTKNENEVNNEV